MNRGPWWYTNVLTFMDSFLNSFIHTALGCLLIDHDIHTNYIHSERSRKWEGISSRLWNYLIPLRISVWCICIIYTTGKNYGIFSISAIFCIFVVHEGCFCVWNAFLRAGIIFWGGNSQLTAKWTAKFENYDFGLFSVLDSVQNSCRLIVRCLPYPIVCCIEKSYTIPLFIYCLIWCDQHGISVVGASRRRVLGVVLACHKTMSKKSHPVTNNRYFHTE